MIAAELLAGSPIRDGEDMKEYRKIKKRFARKTCHELKILFTGFN
jgi:hypothetical protein